MRYLSLFSGIGGFEIGIQKAYERDTIPLTCKYCGKNLKTCECDLFYKSDKTITEFNENIQNLSNPKEHEHEAEDSVSSKRGLDINSEGERLGHPSCVGFSEIDKYAIQIYQKHFPNHKAYGDITKIKPDTLPDFDLLVGGFPCQAFSIAGKRRGFDDTRGTLFFDIARILKEKRPRNFILENVKGLLSHDNGNTFKTIISTLAELGYCVEWQVLNAKNFSVPQNRERVFIVGHLGGIPERKVFPIGGTDETNNGNPEIIQLNQPKHSNDRVYGQRGISPTLNTMQGGNRQPFITGGLQGHQSAKDDGVSPCLTSAMGKGGGQTPIMWSEDIKIRRLTPLECERLMGYPDGWTEGLSDTQRYKTLGNGIVSNVVLSVVKRLYE